MDPTYTHWIDAGSGSTRIQVRLRYFRTVRGLTQQQLAAQVGCRRNQIERWENGRTALSIQALLRLAPLLGCHPLELVRLVPEDTAPSDGRTLGLPWAKPEAQP